MKLAIIGSRKFTDREFLYISANKLSPSEIISGGAVGADALAVDFANDNNIPLIEYKPDLNKYGSPAAFHIRNRAIAEQADIILACCFGKLSGGTKSTVTAARKLNKRVVIITQNPDQSENQASPVGQMLLFS